MLATVTLAETQPNPFGVETCHQADSALRQNTAVLDSLPNEPALPGVKVDAVHQAGVAGRGPVPGICFKPHLTLENLPQQIEAS
ncbi:MAG: hypothetical protein U0401_01555 [Anaerolineae bacterium]